MAPSHGSSWSWGCLFAATPGHAHALIEDAFRRENAEALRVTVTDDAPLIELLRGAGAKVELELLELQGPLR